MAVEAAQLDDPAAFCDTYVHERLHLARADGWHDTVPGHPLYANVEPYPPCHDAWRPRLSRAEAVARVRSRLGRGWRVRAVGRASGDAAFVVAGRRRGAGRRLRRVEFEVWRERAGAPARLARLV
jgi:hypothetical protein